MAEPFDVDVVVIGSSFGGAPAALRFAEHGERVLVLERGAWVSREPTSRAYGLFWNPRRGRFGLHDLRRRGRTILPWISAAVGGGSHLYAGTLKRCYDFPDFPPAITAAELTRFYDTATAMLEPTRYPDYPPYSQTRAATILLDAGRRLQEQQPELVEEGGRIELGIHFAAQGGVPGAPFTNKHGAEQRYWDPQEQSLLGGDIGAKNTLDKNYLHLAQKAGARIQPLSEVDRIEPLPGGGYRVEYKRYLPGGTPPEERGGCTARRVVVAAGCIGSTELLLRNRDIYRTLPRLSRTLGTRYSTNGDFVSLMIPSRAFIPAWLGFLALLVGLALGPPALAVLGAIVCALSLGGSRGALHPDLGPTNSDYIRFRGEDGRPRGLYIQSGRYPTLGKLAVALVLDRLGAWKPRHYATMVRALHFVERFVPPFAILARSWPVAILAMGRDRCLGTGRLDPTGRLVIDFSVAANAQYYRYVNRLSRAVARACRALWIPNLVYHLFGKLEVPHNLGGVPMAETAEQGVVDHAGRVFGYPGLMVLDGSIFPAAIGANPALTILALSERALWYVLEREPEVPLAAAERETPQNANPAI